MVSVGTQHLSVNRILLLAVGLWPFQQSKLVRLQLILFISILTSFIIFQLTPFMTTEFSLTLFVNVLSSVLCFICVVINYSWFWGNLQHVKSLLEQLQYICNELKDANEIHLIEKYGLNAKRLTIKVSLLCICIVSVYVIEPILPRILGVFLFINESQPHRAMYFVTEYFVDEEKYFYLILMHINTATCIGMIIMLATGSLFMVCFNYACGFFRIASYRIEQAITISMLKNINLEDSIRIYKKIVFAVDIHRKAMQFAEFITSSFEVLFFFLIGIAVACLSLNLFGVASLKDDTEELLQPLLRGSGILVCVFLANYVGQKITDHNNYIFFTAYNVQWYNAPLYVQKLILFLLQRGSKTFNLTLGGLFVPSLDGFATMVTASISYCTVIYSTQQ